MGDSDLNQPNLVIEESSSRGLALFLGILSAGIWIWCVVFQLYSKTSFLDDAFIYIHIANNILETGSAQYFPISNNPSLLASSPLRLSILIPSAFIARLLSDPARSIDAFRLTLVVYGLIACAAFLPFYRKKMALWFTGFAFSGLICLSTETGLQMEGLLLFWIVFTLLISFSPKNTDPRFFRKLGILVALLILARPEYGLVAFALSFAYTAWLRKRACLVAYGIPVLALGAGWVLIALLLGVYPVPTTYVTKLMTAKLKLFTDGSFMNVFQKRVEDHFFFHHDLSTLLIPFLWWILLSVTMTISPLYFAASLFTIMSFLIVQREAGNYIWYHENLYIVALTICFGATLLRRPKPLPWWHIPRSAIILVPLFLFFANNIMQNRSMFWNFTEDKSRGVSYKAIGESYQDQGRFMFDDIGPCYLVMDEIGIVSYFGGSNVWLLDGSGLAQAGVLKGTSDLFLSSFFPASIFHTANQELMAILNRFGSPSSSVRLFQAEGNPGPRDIKDCNMYDPDSGVCLREIQWSPPTSDARSAQ
ncbi:MAG: hypothetical protein ABIA59_04270 [Candidatus Latescibacterota bacterium]